MAAFTAERKSMESRDPELLAGDGCTCPGRRPCSGRCRDCPAASEFWTSISKTPGHCQRRKLSETCVASCRNTYLGHRRVELTLDICRIGAVIAAPATWESGEGLKPDSFTTSQGVQACLVAWSWSDRRIHSKDREYEVEIFVMCRTAIK